MRTIVNYAVSHARLTIAILIFLLGAGALSYLSIPKESNPDITVPIIYVNVTMAGISPDDAERLIVRPLESDDEILVPFVSAIVPEVDVVAGRVVVTPPAGLFEALPDDQPEPAEADAAED